MRSVVALELLVPLVVEDLRVAHGTDLEEFSSFCRDSLLDSHSLAILIILNNKGFLELRLLLRREELVVGGLLGNQRVEVHPEVHMLPLNCLLGLLSDFFLGNGEELRP